MFLHERKTLSDDGVYLDNVYTDRFRFASFSLTFSLGKLSFFERQALYTISRMMENGCRDYPTPEKLDIALSMLYDSEIGFSFTECENGVLLHAEADFVNTPLIGTGLLTRILSHIISTLNCPFPDGDAAEELFMRVKEEITADNASLDADPDALSYAAYKDSVYFGYKDRLTTDGIREIPEKITLSDVVAIHDKIMMSPLVYAFCIGRLQADIVADAIKNSLFVKKCEKMIPLSPYPGGRSHVVEGPMGNSSRVYLGFTYDCSNLLADIVAQYLGGVPVSRLYTVLREENSYCYSVFAERSNMGLFTVGATVGQRLENRSIDAILELMKKMQDEKNIKSSVLLAAKEAAITSVKCVYENRRACERFFFSAFIKQIFPDIEGQIDEIRAVGEKDIACAAKKLTKVNDYILFGESGKAQRTRRGSTRGVDKGE